MEPMGIIGLIVFRVSCVWTVIILGVGSYDFRA